MKGSPEQLLVRGLILTQTAVIAAQVLGKDGLASLFFSMTFPFVAAFWLVMVWKQLDVRNGLVLAILLVSGICVAGNALLTGTVVFWGYFKKLFHFWYTLLIFGAMSRYVPEMGDVKLLFRCGGFLSVLLVGLYFLCREQMHMVGGIVSGYLSFRFTNPNLTAVFLAALAILMGIRAVWERGGMRLVFAGLAGLLAIFVWETGSRNGLLILVFFGTVCLGMAVFPRISPIFSFAAVMPLVFAAVYVWFLPNFVEKGWFSFLSGEGKGLDSRVELWETAWEFAGKSPVLGAYSQISGGLGAFQMHNSHLDILVSYGGITLGMVCLFLFGLLENREKRTWNKLCMGGFCGMLLSGIGEAALFSGGLGISVLAGLIRMLANYGQEGRKYEDSLPK